MEEENQLPKLLVDFLNYNRNLNKSNATINEYRYDLIRFLKYMKKTKQSMKHIDLEEIDISDIDQTFLAQIDETDIYAYLSFLQVQRNNSATTRARKIASIKGFFRYLSAKAKVLETNPAKDIETPKLEKRLPKYLTLNESEMLLEETRKGHRRRTNKKNAEAELTKHQQELAIRDYAIVTLFLNCGMRLSELVGINLSRIKMDESVLTVIGKGNKQRTVYLNKACVNAINDYLKVRPVIANGPDKDALFLSDRKKRISRRMVQTSIGQYLQAAGLNGYSVHKLRHTAATLMYQYGVDVRALQEILGHENIGTTEIYTHVNNTQIRQAMENNPLADYEKEKF